VNLARGFMAGVSGGFNLLRCGLEVNSTFAKITLGRDPYRIRMSQKMSNLQYLWCRAKKLRSGQGACSVAITRSSVGSDVLARRESSRPTGGMSPRHLCGRRSHQPRGPENVTETLPAYLCESKTAHHLTIENWLGMDRLSRASRSVFFSRQRLRRVFGHRFTQLPRAARALLAAGHRGSYTGGPATCRRAGR